MRPYPADPFHDSRAAFEAIITELSSDTTHALDHADVEALVRRDGTGLLRCLYQDHLDLRAAREEIEPMKGADGVERTEVRSSSRQLESWFGGVVVHRLALVKHGVSGGLRPMDARLNLPADSFSLGVRREVAWGVANSSYEVVVDDIARVSGASVAKRQAEALAVKSAVDFESFYFDAPEVTESVDDLNVLSFDGKGVVMRPEGLRPETRRRAAAAPKKRRVAPGEKKNRKRMAAVATVYSLPVVGRTVDDVLTELERSGPHVARPKPRNKRVWASLEHPMRQVVADAFDEAARRDAFAQRRWVVLVDGNEDQLRAVEAEAHGIGIEVTIVLDFIHVLEYLWRAAYALLGAGNEHVESWVTERARRILEGDASTVAAGIRRSATARRLRGKRRKAIDKCADYLLNHKEYLRYDEYLCDGLPIATGVIEGACRSLVRDRMDITGARWGLQGAEAVLKLRALRASGDFDEYWRYHRKRELDRNHLQSFDPSELSELREAA